MKILGLFILIFSVICFQSCNSKQIPVYYLKKEFDYRNLIDYTKPDIDCVHTVGDPMPFPEKITICSRNLHITYENPVISSYATAFGFGTMLDDWSELKEGQWYKYL